MRGTARPRRDIPRTACHGWRRVSPLILATLLLLGGVALAAQPGNEQALSGSANLVAHTAITDPVQPRAQAPCLISCIVPNRPQLPQPIQQLLPPPAAVVDEVRQAVPPQAAAAVDQASGAVDEVQQAVPPLAEAVDDLAPALPVAAAAVDDVAQAVSPSQPPAGATDSAPASASPPPPAAASSASGSSSAAPAAVTTGAPVPASPPSPAEVAVSQPPSPPSPPSGAAPEDAKALPGGRGADAATGSGVPAQRGRPGAVDQGAAPAPSATDGTSPPAIAELPPSAVPEAPAGVTTAAPPAAVEAPASEPPAAEAVATAPLEVSAEAVAVSSGVSEASDDPTATAPSSAPLFDAASSSMSPVILGLIPGGLLAVLLLALLTARRLGLGGAGLGRGSMTGSAGRDAGPDSRATRPDPVSRVGSGPAAATQPSEAGRTCSDADVTLSGSPTLLDAAREPAVTTNGAATLGTWPGAASVAYLTVVRDLPIDRLGDGLDLARLTHQGLMTNVEGLPSDEPILEAPADATPIGHLSDRYDLDGSLTTLPPPSCSRCGHARRATARFCSRCGVSLYKAG